MTRMRLMAVLASVLFVTAAGFAQTPTGPKRSDTHPPGKNPHLGNADSIRADHDGTAFASPQWQAACLLTGAAPAGRWQHRPAHASGVAFSARRAPRAGWRGRRTAGRARPRPSPART